MHPQICTIGPFTIYSYGLMLALAFIISAGLAAKEAKAQGVNPQEVYHLSFLAMIFGILGARIFYVLENLRYYRDNPVEVILLQHGGLSWFGGLILGTIAAGVYLKRKQLAVYKVLDLLAPFIALAQAIGRIGCLLNGCCYGKVSRFGIYFPVHAEYLIPTQAYSSLVLLGIFFVLRLLQLRPHLEGQIFFTYLLLYCLKRFFLEFWRADNPVVFLGLTLFQILSILTFFVAVVSLSRRRKTAAFKPRMKSGRDSAPKGKTGF